MPKQIFISYSRVDTNFVTHLIDDLTKQGLNVWLDQRNIGAGQRWDNTIQQALESSDLFVIVLTPSSVASENVLDELSYAINARKRIIPILFRNCEIPYRIARIQFVDFTRDYQTGFRHLASEISQQSPQRPVIVKKQSASKQIILWLAGLAAAFIFCVALGVGIYMLYPYYLPTPTPVSQVAAVPTTPRIEAIPTTPRVETAPTIAMPPSPTQVPAQPPQPTDVPSPTLVPPHAPAIDNTYGVPLYDEHQELITLTPGEQKTLKIMEMWSAPEGAAPSCASGFMALTWIVRDPYPFGGEDLQLLRLIPMGGGRTEVFASGMQGTASIGYCEEIDLFNNSLQNYRVEIRYASGIYQ